MPQLDPLIESAIADAAQAETQATKASSFSRFIMLVALIAGVAVATFLGIFLAMSITGPINRIINDLRVGAEQVSSASPQVSSASQSLADGATEQAGGLQETSSSLEEMSSMTQQNANNAQAEQMNNSVNELLALVGGSDTTSITMQPQPNVRPKHSPPQIGVCDQTYHQIARPFQREQARETRSKRPLSPQQVIPLDAADQQFSDFDG